MVHVNYTLHKFKGLNLGRLYPVRHGDRKWLSLHPGDFPTVTSGHEVRVWFFSAVECCTGAYAALAELYYKPTVGPLGSRPVGWRMGIQGSLWRSCWIIHVPPPLLASIPLCSASTETSITEWIRDLCLSPSLNLKWGALCWFSKKYIWRQQQDKAVVMPRNITAFSTESRPEVILLSLKVKHRFVF